MDMESSSIKIIIEVRGGIVQFISSNTPMDICIIDHDNIEDDESLDHVSLTSPDILMKYPSGTISNGMCRKHLQEHGY